MMKSEIESNAVESTVLPPVSDTLSQPDRKPAADRKPDSEKPQILSELVIEEVSIDGMCGVY